MLEPSASQRANTKQCPRCQHDVAIDAAIVCLNCLARHHGACWVDACASCGSARALVPMGAPLGERESPLLPEHRPVARLPTGYAAVVVVLVGALLDFDHSLMLGVLTFGLELLYGHRHAQRALEVARARQAVMQELATRRREEASAALEASAFVPHDVKPSPV